MDVFPDFEGLGGVGDLQEVVGAALMIALIVAVLMLIVSGIIWAIATATGNYQAAAKARAGTLVALGGAILAGAAVTWLNWLIDLGGTLSTQHRCAPVTPAPDRGGRRHVRVPRAAALTSQQNRPISRPREFCRD